MLQGLIFVTSQKRCKLYSVTPIKYLNFAYIAGLHLDPEKLDVGENILLSNLREPWAPVCYLDKRPFIFPFKSYMVNNGTELC